MALIYFLKIQPPPRNITKIAPKNHKKDPKKCLRGSFVKFEDFIVFLGVFLY
jgi:hypothetical protein